MKTQQKIAALNPVALSPAALSLASLILAVLAVAGCSQTEIQRHSEIQQHDETQLQGEVQRYGMVIGIKPEKIPEYKALHADCWPGVLKMIRACNIRNYSIYLCELEEGKHYLFSYFEYTGDDFDGDMKKMAADGTTQMWWKRTDPCQEPIPLREEGEFWAKMEEVFHSDGSGGIPP